MRFNETLLAGAFVIEVEPHTDDRGLFARTFCAQEFQRHGLSDGFVQCSTSWNVRKGTLRGLHYQRAPAGEIKLVRCTAGSVWDVIVDLRTDSPTYLQHVGVELSARNRRALYVPDMCAHGFQTLEDDTEVSYQMTAFHAPDLAAGVRYDDGKLRITWPLVVAKVSERDQTWPLLT
jgi:dTDP-4-dehydrorhamnose 3,5-epimerase